MPSPISKSINLITPIPQQALKTLGNGSRNCCVPNKIANHGCLAKPVIELLNRDEIQPDNEEDTWKSQNDECHELLF